MNGALIEFLYRGRVAPLTALDYPKLGKAGRFDGGIRYRSGEVCEIGRQIKGPYKNEPQEIDETRLITVKGRYVFGGMLQNEHFGHFVAESLSRLWAFGQLSAEYNTVVFYLRKPDAPIPDFVTDLLKLLLPGVNLHILSEPTQFEVIAVPQQLIHSGNSCMYGHPLVVEICRKLQTPSEHRPKKIYVSRSKLSRRNGGILADQSIDRYLAAEGYAVLYPEGMTVADQLSAYASAERLIFAEGSALHLYALVASHKQRVFAIWRRGRHSLFDWQVRSFSDQSVQGDAFIKQLWVPDNEVPDAVHGMSLLNLSALSLQLRDMGFIENAPWIDPAPDEIERELHEIAVKTKRNFVNVLNVAGL